MHVPGRSASYSRPRWKRPRGSLDLASRGLRQGRPTLRSRSKISCCADRLADQGFTLTPRVLSILERSTGSAELRRTASRSVPSRSAKSAAEARARSIWREEPTTCSRSTSRSRSCGRSTAMPSCCGGSTRSVKSSPGWIIRISPVCSMEARPKKACHIPSWSMSTGSRSTSIATNAA